MVWIRLGRQRLHLWNWRRWGWKPAHRHGPEFVGAWRLGAWALYWWKVID